MRITLAPGGRITVGRYRYENHGTEPQTIHIREESDTLTSNVSRCHAAEAEAEEWARGQRRGDWR